MASMRLTSYPSANVRADIAAAARSAMAYARASVSAQQKMPTPGPS